MQPPRNAGGYNVEQQRYQQYSTTEIHHPRYEENHMGNPHGRLTWGKGLGGPQPPRQQYNQYTQNNFHSYGPAGQDGI